MNIRDILKKVDHTVLAQAATWEEIQTACDDAVRYQTASVCLPPAFVQPAYHYLKGNQKICTVIGFPNGYQTTKTKCYETEDALQNGADEIDMVIHIGMLRDRQSTKIGAEIQKIKNICGDHVLKVIVETCLLTESEKIEMCHIVSESGADFIKTSTGFSKGGATFDDIALFARCVRPGLGIKAAGGIRNFEDAERFLALGATRLGTSRLISILKERS